MAAQFISFVTKNMEFLELINQKATKCGWEKTLGKDGKCGRD